MIASILGIGTAQPPRFMSQPDAAELAIERSGADARQSRVLRALYRHTTVERRAVSLLEPAAESAAGTAAGDSEATDVRWFYHPAGGEAPARGPSTAARMAQYRQRAPGLACAASAAALADAGTTPDRVTHLIVVTCTGFAAPGVVDVIIRTLALDRGVRRTVIGFMGCHAALNGLQVADAIVRGDPDARVLVCSVELCSLHFQYGWSAERNVANALFADGAAAVVVGRADDDAPRRWRLVDHASRLIDDSDDAMSWLISDHGFVMTLSARVPDLVAAHLRPWLDEWLDAHGLSIGAVPSWAVHAGGPRIVGAVTDRLGLDAAAGADSRAVLRECGNMSSATVLFVLERMHLRRAPGPCVVLAFGPGLVAEAALLE